MRAARERLGLRRRAAAKDSFYYLQKSLQEREKNLKAQVDGSSHTYIHIYIHAYSATYATICILTYDRIYHTYIHTYMYIQLHTHTFIYTHILVPIIHYIHTYIHKHNLYNIIATTIGWPRSGQADSLIVRSLGSSRGGRHPG